MGTILAIDIGGTTVKYGEWKENQFISRGKRETPETWKDMKTLIKNLYNSCQNAEGIAISSPGSVDTVNGIIHGISAIPYIHNFPIRDELEQYLGVPVSIQNDANCAALAENWIGNAKDVDDFVSIIIGSGVGGSVIMNKKLKAGSNLFGGEFGYMILDVNDDRTFSELVSPVNLAKQYSSENNREINGKQLFDLSDSGDDKACQIVDDFYKHLAVGVFNLLVSYDPDLVLIGGAISERPGLIKTLNKYINQLIIAKRADGLKYNLKTCYFYGDANMIGAIYQYKTNFITFNTI